MTLEDFTESVIAGYVPLSWHVAVHLVAIACKWFGVQFVVMVAVRLRK
jgi:hypothetical protein